MINQEQLRRGSMFPNLEFSLNLGVDMTDKQYYAMSVSSGSIGSAPSGPIIPPVRVVGILQNAPTAIESAIIRYHGWSYAAYGEDIAEGDIVRVGDSGLLAPFVLGMHGHTHAQGTTIPDLTFMVYVESLLGVPATGLTSSEIETHKYYLQSGVITEYSPAPSVAEIGGGWYSIQVTAMNHVGMPHRVSITSVSGNNTITPSQHQWTADTMQYATGPPKALDYNLVLGQALTSGTYGDFGLIMIRPQLF